MELSGMDCGWNGMEWDGMECSGSPDHWSTIRRRGVPPGVAIDIGCIPARIVGDKTLRGGRGVQVDLET